MSPAPSSMLCVTQGRPFNCDFITPSLKRAGSHEIKNVRECLGAVRHIVGTSYYINIATNAYLTSGATFSALYIENVHNSSTNLLRLY